MEQLELKAEPRTVTGKAVRHLRREGIVPAVIYGHKIEPIAIQVAARELGYALQRGAGSQLVSLTLPGGGQPRMTLIRDIQRHPTSRAIVHVDFLEVVMTEKIQTAISLTFEGEPAVVRLGDGVMFHGLDEVDVECLPGDLVPTIRVDLSGLQEIDATLYVRDLEIPRGIEVLTSADEVVARILPVRAEEVEEVEAEAEGGEVQVITEQRAEQRRTERPREEEGEA